MTQEGIKIGVWYNLHEDGEDTLYLVEGYSNKDYRFKLKRLEDGLNFYILDNYKYFDWWEEVNGKELKWYLVRNIK